MTIDALTPVDGTLISIGETAVTTGQQWIALETGELVAGRPAEFWQPTDAGRVTCDLCYRRCDLAPDEAGWCGVRVNREGELTIPQHGIAGALWFGGLGYGAKRISGYDHATRLYKAGALVLKVAGIACTSGCTFCMSRDLALRPERLPWRVGEQQPATGQLFNNQRAVVTPWDVVQMALDLGCQIVSLGENEPMLTWEYSYDIARLGKAHGLDVALYTNGFSSPAAIERIAPYIDLVGVGIKGSADPAFYAQWMRAPGAVPTVLEACRVWQAAGVRTAIVDLLAAPHMQDYRTTEAAMQRLYSWIATTLGPHTPVFLTAMHNPATNELLETRPVGGVGSVWARFQMACGLAAEAGLRYVITDWDIACHACGEPLIEVPEQDRHAAGYHTQHVTDSQCNHCGAAVPIVVLPDDALAVVREHAQALEAAGWLR